VCVCVCVCVYIYIYIYIYIYMSICMGNQQVWYNVLAFPLGVITYPEHEFLIQFCPIIVSHYTVRNNVKHFTNYRVAPTCRLVMTEEGGEPT